MMGDLKHAICDPYLDDVLCHSVSIDEGVGNMSDKPIEDFSTFQWAAPSQVSPISSERIMAVTETLQLFQLEPNRSIKLLDPKYRQKMLRTECGSVSTWKTWRDEDDFLFLAPSDEFFIYEERRPNYQNVIFWSETSNANIFEPDCKQSFTIMRENIGILWNG